MRMKYISKIQSNLRKYRTIHTQKATSRILDGSYNSIYKGRSMNFDELREYVSGDDIKDMDWKASARSQKLLVRQYIAEKKHNIMLVVDTNKRMLAETKDGEEKREVALMSAGILAYLVNRNGDYVSSTYMSEIQVKNYPFRTGLMHVENILTNYHKDVTMNNTSMVGTVLDYLIRHFRRKMIIIVVSDLEGFKNISETTLKSLLLIHDVLAIQISDADMYGRSIYDVEEGRYLPDYITGNKKLRVLEYKRKQEAYLEVTNKLKRNGIALATINNVNEISAKIIELLEKHKLEKR